MNEQESFDHEEVINNFYKDALTHGTGRLLAKFDKEKGCLKIKRISPEDFYKNKNEKE